MVPFMFGLPALAATLSVGPGQPHPSLGAALAAAVDGDTIEVEPGTYAEQLTVRVDVTIRAINGGVTWTNEGTDDALTIDDGAVVRIEGIDFRSSFFGRAIDLTSGELTLVDADIRGVRALDRPGAAVAVRAGATLRVEDSAFVDNSSGDLQVGGHVFAEGATVVLERVWLAEGAAGAGGAAHVTDTRLTLIDCQVDDNEAAEGGGLYASGSAVTISGGRFVGNTAESLFGDGAGGGARLVDASIGTWTAVEWRDNETDGDGGAVDLDGAGAVWIEANAFADNRADGDGGAIRAAGGTQLTLSGGLLTGQEAGNIGGAALIESPDAHLHANTFCDNRAGFGGALYDRAERTRVTNNVFQGNDADDAGGAIRSRESVAMEVVNNTFVDNGAASGGAAAAADSDVSFINNAVAFHRTGGGLIAENSTGALSHSLFFDNQPTDLSANLLNQIGPDVVFVEPGFVAVSDDGTCNDDFHPEATSALIDAGDPARFDTDGTRSDIGAFGGSAAVDPPDADGDGYPADTDCDDGDPAVNPGATEDCSAVDRDCSGDPTDAVGVGSPWFPDGDGDGVGRDSGAVVACVAPDGHVLSGGDCDDDDPSVSPLATETCDGRDETCDGVADEGLASATFWVDVDGDSFGAGPAYAACAAPQGYAAVDGDCDDADPAVNPSAADPAGDGVDADCDGADGTTDGAASPDPVDGEALKASGGCGCASAAPSGIAWLAVVGLAVVRLRRGR